MSLAARLVLGLVLLGLAAAGGWRQGVKSTLADWRASDLAAERASRDRAEEDRRLARRSAERYEAERDQIQQSLQEARHALARPLATRLQCPPAAADMALGDVLLPAGTLDGLRQLAAGTQADRSPAPLAGQALQPRP